jgi:hypothetical protein
MSFKFTDDYERLKDAAEKLADDEIKEGTHVPAKNQLNKTNWGDSGLSRKELAGTPTLVKPMNPSVRLRPHISHLLGDTYTIISESLRILREKVESGKALTPTEARQFATYSDTLVKLAREEREQLKHSDPSQLSDDELLTLLDEAKKALGQ